MIQARRKMFPFYLREVNLNKTHFPSRRFLCTRNGAGCFSDCIRFRLSSCGSCLCFFLYFGLDGNKAGLGGRASFKPKWEPRCQGRKKVGKGRKKQSPLPPGQHTPSLDPQRSLSEGAQKEPPQARTETQKRSCIYGEIVQRLRRISASLWVGVSLPV